MENFPDDEGRQYCRQNKVQVILAVMSLYALLSFAIYLLE